MKKQRIRNNVRFFREEADMTQLTLSRLANVTPSAVSEIEAEKREPELFTALKLARALDITIDYLFILEKEG